MSNAGSLIWSRLFLGEAKVVVKIGFEPWEPEETIGKLWHKFASRLDAPDAHEGAAVDLSEVAGRLAVFFRGLGGNPAAELRATPDEISHHRLSWRRRLGTGYDGEILFQRSAYCLQTLGLHLIPSA